LRSGSDEVVAGPTKKVDIRQLAVGRAEFLIWEGRPVVVYRRRQQEIAVLSSQNPLLLDPESKKSDQPESMRHDRRSQDDNWFVAIALGTDLGCRIDLLAASSEVFQGQPWAGGFVDTCRQSRFDLAGRVFKSQYATKNLVVPTYSVEEGSIILGR